MKAFIRILFIALFGELAIGGGGRMLAIGPVSLRMMLFIIACGTAAIITWQTRSFPKGYIYLALAFSALIVLGVVVGALNGALPSSQWEDVKPLLYFFILPFFWTASADRKLYDDTRAIIQLSALIQALCFFLILVLIHSGTIPFLDFYAAVIDTGEFFFRGEITFFYKGFIYLCIGCIFLVFTGGKYRFVYLGIIGLAVIASLTRGFLLAFALTAVVYLIHNKKPIAATAVGGFALIIISFGNLAVENLSVLVDRLRHQEVSFNADHPNTKLLGDRNFSDVGRTQQIKEVIRSSTPVSFIAGHGFGVGIPSRPIHMEISYLEIFHKQGVIGLGFWGFLLWLLFRKYKSATPGRMSNAFFYSGIFVFLQSLTNQFINNPIGLSMVLLAVVCLDRLNSSEPAHFRPSSNQKSTALEFQSR